MCYGVVVCYRCWFAFIADVDGCLIVADVGCMVCRLYVRCVVLVRCCALCAACLSLSLSVVGCRCGLWIVDCCVLLCIAVLC